MTFNITPSRISAFKATAANACTPSVDELRAAAAVFAKRSDYFANGKAETCHDIADRLNRNGAYASEKQQEFARKLVEWSKPRVTSDARPNASKLLVPSLFEVMQRLADVTLPTLKISRKNQDSLCWLIDNNGEDTCIGKIEDGAVTLFTKRMAGIGVEPTTVLDLLRTIEANPIKAIADAGRASGRCAICSRDLTDAESIERGIGPVCAGKLFA